MTALRSITPHPIMFIPCSTPCTRSAVNKKPNHNICCLSAHVKHDIAIVRRFAIDRDYAFHADHHVRVMRCASSARSGDQAGASKVRPVAGRVHDDDDRHQALSIATVPLNLHYTHLIMARRRLHFRFFSFWERIIRSIFFS